MLLTPDDLDQIRGAIEAAGELDSELAQRCGQLINMGAPDDAVRNAFVILENRLRTALGPDMPTNRDRPPTGADLANSSFKADGPLTKRLQVVGGEAEGWRELFSGAFKALRNPIAHGPIGLKTKDAKAIIAFVSHLLGVLDRTKPTSPTQLPPNVIKRLSAMQTQLGPDIVGRLQRFLETCIRVGLRPASERSVAIPFHTDGMIKHSHWPKARRWSVPIFYVRGVGNRDLEFPVNNAYIRVEGLQIRAIEKQLKDLGMRPIGKQRRLCADLRKQNDSIFFGRLLEVVEDIAAKVEKTVE
jgi:hypothetical protein